MIYIIVGASGSGKTYLEKLMLSKNKKLKKLIQCTTRKIREGEVDGEDYYFIDDDIYNNFLHSKQFIEHDNGTLSGGRCKYGLLFTEIDSSLRENKDAVIVMSPLGAQAMYEKYKEDEIKIIYIHSNDAERHIRLVERLNQTTNIEEVKYKIEDITSRIREEYKFDRFIFNNVSLLGSVITCVENNYYNSLENFVNILFE